MISNPEHRVKVTNPVVEMDGDEMTRVIWRLIKEKLIFPFVDVPVRYFDLSIQNRDATDDRVTREAAQAIQECRVGIKCATITADADRQREFNLKKLWPTPNGTIRSILGGTVFREPILLSARVPRIVPGWRQPIIVGRHACGDQYQAVDLAVPAGSTVELCIRDAQGLETRHPLHSFPPTTGGVALGMFNEDQVLSSLHIDWCPSIDTKMCRYLLDSRSRALPRAALRWPSLGSCPCT
jgi:isocitrate dehydrogenase